MLQCAPNADHLSRPAAVKSWKILLYESRLICFVKHWVLDVFPFSPVLYGWCQKRRKCPFTSTSKDKYIHTVKYPKYADNPFGFLLVINLPKTFKSQFLLCIFWVISLRCLYSRFVHFFPPLLATAFASYHHLSPGPLHWLPGLSASTLVFMVHSPLLQPKRSFKM